MTFTGAGSVAKLAQYGMHFDDLNRIRVLDEDTANQAEELKQTCNEFIFSANEFNKIADSFIEIFDAVSKEVEREKISAIGARNLLHTASKQRETQLQQLTALLREKQLEYDRLASELASLKKMEITQQEFIEQFALQK